MEALEQAVEDEYVRIIDAVDDALVGVVARLGRVLLRVCAEEFGDHFESVC